MLITFLWLAAHEKKLRRRNRTFGFLSFHLFLFLLDDIDRQENRVCYSDILSMVYLEYFARFSLPGFNSSKSQ